MANKSCAFRSFGYSTTKVTESGLLQMINRTALKCRLAQASTLMAPGVYDGLSATLAAQAGFGAVCLAGFAVSGSTLGMPDIGRMTATEMADRARALPEAAAPVPLIADGDNGHGSELNVARL